MLCQNYKYSSKMFYTHRRGCPRLILECLNNMDIKIFIKQMDSSRCHYRSNDKNQTFCILSALFFCLARPELVFPAVVLRLDLCFYVVT